MLRYGHATSDHNSRCQFSFSEIAQNSIIATEVGAGEPVPAGVDQPQMLGYPQFIHFNPHMMQQFMGQQGPVSSAAGGQEKEDAGHAGQSPFAFNPGFSNPVFAQAMGFHMMQAAANMSRYPHPGSTGANVPHGNDPRLTGRPPICLYMTCDNDSLSEYQCLVRKQIQLFEATPEDADTNAQGRNKPIQAGQLGICCRHCCFLPPKHRSRGAVYYPAKLDGLYQGMIRCSLVFAFLLKFWLVFLHIHSCSKYGREPFLRTLSAHAADDPR